MGCQGRRGIHRVLCALLLGALGWGAPAAAANTIDVTDVQVGESGNAVFNVTREAGLLSGGTTATFHTVDGSASSATDYVAASGTLTFGSAPFGATQVQQVVVALRPDALDEDNESFRLVMSGSEVADGDGTATIVDDDATPSLSVADSPTVTEGAGAQATFVVRLSAVSGRSVSVGYSTANGSATAGQDYSARSGTLVLSAGTAQATVAVPVLDDAADEPAESFELRLSSPVSATIADGAATATIADNDEPPAPPPPTAAPPPAGGSQQPSGPAVALPAVGSPAMPAATTGSSTANAALGVSSPRLKRPSTVLVTISCPAAAGRCRGRITIFSVPSAKSKIKALRHERKLGRLTFAVAGGHAQTVALRLGATDRALLRRTGRMRVRAYALTQDSAGRTGVRTVSGTLIARTAHSSPSRG
ncbi:MAG: large repetitive protein [bacterium]|jgi:hypothetical protein